MLLLKSQCRLLYCWPPDWITAAHRSNQRITLLLGCLLRKLDALSSAIQKNLLEKKLLYKQMAKISGHDYRSSELNNHPTLLLDVR